MTARSLPAGTVSAVVPVLDEAGRIANCLDRLRRDPGIAELIVVDGGSRDDTVAIARGWAADHPDVSIRVLTAPRGRASQQNAGLAAARGEVVIFVHADVVLPAGAGAAARQALGEPGVVAGAFRTRHVAERWRGRRRAALLRLADLRSRYSRLPYGDQAIFARRELLARLGGFPAVALMEDLALSRRLVRAGRVRIVPAEVEVSARRFEGAPLYQTLLVNVFPLLYDLGVPTAVLARLYGNPR